MQELPVASLSFAFPLFSARPTNNFFSFSSPPFESDWGRGRASDAYRHYIRTLPDSLSRAMAGL
jgi:hypothetical protein